MNYQNSKWQLTCHLVIYARPIRNRRWIVYISESKSIVANITFSSHFFFLADRLQIELLKTFIIHIIIGNDISAVKANIFFWCSIKIACNINFICWQEKLSWFWKEQFQAQRLCWVVWCVPKHIGRNSSPLYIRSNDAKF